MRILFVIIVSCVAALATNTAKAELYVVTGKAVVVRKGPAVSEPAVSTVKKNQVINGTTLGPWVRMQFSGGTQGYISAKYLKPAPDGAIESPIPGPVELPQQSNSESKELAKSPAIIVARTKLRKEANSKSPVYRYLEKGEKIQVLDGSDGWAQVETRWKFESGKPMIGYICVSDIRLDAAENEATKNSNLAMKSEGPKSITPDGSLSLPLTVGGNMPPDRVVSIIPVETKAEARAVKMSQDTATAQIKALQVEKTKLSAEVTKHLGEIKALQVALASADSRFRESEITRQKMSAELKSLKEQYAELQARFAEMTDGGKNKLVALADRGESVFFKGVGEAKMAAVEGRTVLRFPLTMSSKADKAFMGAKAERHLQGAYAYYILDSKLLAF